MQLSVRHPVCLFNEAGGALYDFTDRCQLGVERLGGTLISVRDILGKHRLYVPSASTAPSLASESGRMLLRSVEDTDLLATLPGNSLLPATGDFVLGWSHKTLASGIRACIWQQQAGAEGRTQITANGRYDGSRVLKANGRLQVFMAGVSGGSGPNGMIANAPHVVGEWDHFVLVMREGVKKSAFYRNGTIVDTFTRPASIPQLQTTLFRNRTLSGEGQVFGRIFCLYRAPVDGELDQINNWLAESYADSDIINGAEEDDCSRSVQPSLLSSSAALWSKNAQGFDDGLIWGVNINSQFSPASMTKIMTCYTGLYWLKKLNHMDIIFTRNIDDLSSGSGSNLDVGDTIDVENALANMGLPSSNVTAYIWARTIGNLISASEGGPGGISRFVAEMNIMSAKLAMAATNWVNPAGFDRTGQLSTAADMARLCIAVENDAPEIARIWACGSWPLTITGVNSRIIRIDHSVNFIANSDPRVTWGKTGTTPLGGKCLMCEVGGHHGNRYYYIGFGSPTDDGRYSDANAVFDAVNNGVGWPKPALATYQK